MAINRHARVAFVAGREPPGKKAPDPPGREFRAVSRVKFSPTSQLVKLNREAARAVLTMSRR